MFNENKLYVANNAGGIYRIQKLACQHSSQKSKGLEARNQKVQLTYNLNPAKIDVITFQEYANQIPVIVFS